jgi:hypothetical protein
LERTSADHRTRDGQENRRRPSRIGQERTATRFLNADRQPRNAGLPPERRIEFRVGIHVGDVVEESDGDLMGGGVNIAARLERIAKPGTICLSEDAYRKGGETVKPLSTAFFADLEEDWRNHGKEIFPILREKYPQAYFQGIVSLARFIRWDDESTGGLAYVYFEGKSAERAAVKLLTRMWHLPMQRRAEDCVTVQSIGSIFIRRTGEYRCRTRSNLRRSESAASMRYRC